MIYRLLKNTPQPSKGSKSGGTNTSSPAAKSSGGSSWATKPQEQTGFDLSQEEFTPAQELPELGTTINTGSPNILNNGGFMQDIEANMMGTRSKNISAQGQGASQANLVAAENQESAPLGMLESMGNSFSNFANRLRGTIPRLNVVAADTWENVLGKELTKKWYEFEGRDIDQERSEAYAELEQLATEMKPTLGLVGAIEEGSMKQFAAGLVNTITSLGSSVVPAMATAGAGIFTEMTGDALVEYNTEKAKRLGISVDELYKSGQADFQVPAMIGTASGALELVGLKGVGNLITKKVTGTAFKKGLFYFGQTQREGLTELLQNGLQAANKTIGAGGTPGEADQSFSDAVFSRDGLEAYLQGAFGAAGAGAIANVASLVNKPSSKGSISQAIQNIGLAEMNLSNPEISEQSRAVLTDQVNRSISEIAETVEQDEKATEQLSDSQKKQMTEIDAKITQLETVIADPNVTEDVKIGLQSEISGLESQLNTINPEAANGSLNIPEIKEDAAARVNQAIEITDQLTDQLADATSIEEISEIKEVAVAAVQQGIEATQTLNQSDRASLNLESKSSYKKGDAVSFVDEQGNNVSGLFKELTDDNKMVIGINEDGIYKEQTIPLPEIEPGTETKIDKPEPVENSVSAENAQTAQEVVEPTEFEGKTAEDLASMYNDEINNPSLSAKERAIADMPFYLRRDSYVNFNDANNITSSKARSYFRKNGLGADQIAQEINNTKFDGNEVVTPQDIVDFVDTYPNGPQTIYQPSGNPRLGSINEAYFNITGKKLNKKTAADIAKTVNDSIETAENEQIASLDEELLTFVAEEGITLENLSAVEQQLGWLFGDELEAGVIFNHIREYLENEAATNPRTEEGISQGEGSTEIGSPSSESTGVEGTEGPASESSSTDTSIDPIVEIDGKEVDLSKTNEDDDAQIIAQSFFNPLSAAQKAIDRLENATTAKLATKITDAVAERLKAWRTSKSTAKQMASSFASLIFGGIARNGTDINMKLGLIGGKNMAVYNMGKVMKGLYNIVNGNTESLERVHIILDPEFYANAASTGNMFKTYAPANLSYADLTAEEQQLYDEIRKNLDDIHFKNYALGLIDVDTFDKYKDNYVPRMYETFELPSEIQEVLDQYQDQIGDKLNLNPFKKRKGLDNLSDESKNAVLKDPVYLMAKRLMELDTNSAIMTYINHINRNNRKMVYDGPTPPVNYFKLEGKAYGALNGKYVPSFVAEDLKGYFFVQKGLNNAYDVIKGYDRTWARKAVKKGLTVFNPFVQIGNFTSNIVFAQMAGIDFVRWFGNTSKAFSSLKAESQEYQDLLAAGLIGTDILKSDLMPNTERANSMLQSAQAKKDAGIMSKVLKPLKKANDAAMSLYSGNDDLAKLNAYMIFLEQGYAKDEAIKKVYDGFQNYATVGKFWDIASKAPVLGNPFMKFPADLMRITGNAVSKKPLSTALYVAGLYMVPQILNQIGIGDEDEDDLEKELREGRPFIPKMDLGVINVPLVYKTTFGEVNLARYVTPYYFFDNGEDGAFSSMISRFNPLKTVKTEGYGKGNERTIPFGQDPVLGTLYNIIMDTDFRGKSIQDPDATRFRASGVTNGQKFENQATHALRTWIPNGSLMHDTYLNSKYGEDFYGRTRTMAQSLVNFAVKIQQFEDTDYARTAEKQVYSMTNDLKSQSETIKNTYANDSRKRKKLQDNLKDGKIDASDYKNSIDKLDKELKSSIDVGYKKHDELKKKLNEFATKYKRFL